MITLSIITVNLNNKKGLENTLQSVVNQSFNDYEYLIIDGESLDGSKEVILSNRHLLNYWISEADNGIYHAMNKGIRAAKGEYCLFLNSGDWLSEPTILEKVFAQNPQADIVAGDVYFFDAKLNTIKWLIASPSQPTAKTLFLGTLPHQATFIRRSLFDHIGLYNEQLKIASDWLFFEQALLEHGCSYQHFPGTIAYFNMDGVSCDPASKSLPRREQLGVLQQKYPRFLPDYERLDTLEKQTEQWFASREYRVYHFLERTGIIRMGVLARRFKRLIKRTLFRQNP